MLNLLQIKTSLIYPVHVTAYTLEGYYTISMVSFETSTMTCSDHLYDQKPWLTPKIFIFTI